MLGLSVTVGFAGREAGSMRGEPIAETILDRAGVNRADKILRSRTSVKG